MGLRLLRALPLLVLVVAALAWGNELEDGYGYGYGYGAHAEEATGSATTSGTTSTLKSAKKMEDKLAITAAKMKTAVKEGAAKKEAASKNAAKKETANKNAAKRERANKNAAKRETASKNAAKRERANKNAAKRETANKNAAKKETASKNAAQRERANKNAAKKETANTNAAKKGTANKNAATYSRDGEYERSMMGKNAAQKEVANTNAVTYSREHERSMMGFGLPSLTAATLVCTDAYSDWGEAHKFSTKVKSWRGLNKFDNIGEWITVKKKKKKCRDKSKPCTKFFHELCVQMSGKEARRGDKEPNCISSEGECCQALRAHTKSQALHMVIKRTQELGHPSPNA